MLPQPGELGPDEFLAWERQQVERHLYVDGEVVSMSGGSPRHNHLGMVVGARLLIGLADTHSGCRVFSADQKLGVSQNDFVYADAVVVCGPLQLRPGTRDVITNPVIVVEVLSKTTEAYDRGAKQKGYLALPSLEDFLLVSQREARVEHYARQDDGSFRYEVLGPGTHISLRNGTVPIAVDDLYASVLDLPGD